MYTLDETIKEEKWFLKDIIIEFEEELNNKAFDVIYDNINGMHLKAAFTALLLKNNINPLEYMDEVPVYFAYELDIKEFVIPNNITTISYGAFEGCSSLTSITIPDSVTSIDDYAFSKCSSLAEITIPDSVTSIYDHAFYKCINLNSVTIPKNIKNIYNFAFKDCESLTDVYYKGSEEDWKNIKIGDYGGYYNDELLNATIHYNS